MVTDFNNNSTPWNLTNAREKAIPGRPDEFAREDRLAKYLGVEPEVILFCALAAAGMPFQAR